MRKSLIWLLAALVLAAIGLSLTVRFAAARTHRDFNPGSVRVEVLNGSGVPRMGKAVADDLRGRRFQVFRVDNADSVLDRTTLVERRATDAANAARTADYLAVQRRWWVFAIGPRRLPEVVVDLDSACYLDVSVVVGRDHELFFPRAVTLR